MCLAKVTTPTPETEVLIGFPFFALVFFVFVLFSLAAPILVHGARWNFFSNNKLTCHTFDYHKLLKHFGWVSLFSQYTSLAHLVEVKTEYVCHQVPQCNL